MSTSQVQRRVLPGSRLAGRMLFHCCEHIPGLKHCCRSLGMQTAGRDLGPSIGHIQFPDRNGFKLASIGEDPLSFELFWKGGEFYEPITRLLVQELVRPGETFVDVGANIGFFSLVVATYSPRSRVISFEPNPRSFSLLGRNMSANRLGNVICEQYALSDTERTLPLYLHESGLKASLAPTGSGQTGTIDVRAVSLDRYLERYRVRGPMVLKVDVVGHEEELFRGMHRTLDRYRPDIVTEVALQCPNAVIDQLACQGYRFYLITDMGLIPSLNLQPALRGQFYFQNYLLTARPEAEVHEIYRRIAPVVQAIDLRKTSKFMPEVEELKELTARTFWSPQGPRVLQRPAIAGM